MFLSFFWEITLLVFGLILFGVISWREINWGVYLVVLFLPLYLLKLKIWQIPTTVLELMIYVLFIVWLVRKLGYANSNLIRIIKKFLILNSKFIIPIGLIFAGVTLSTLYSSNLRASAGIWKGWIIDPLLLFIVLVSVVKTEKHIKNTLYALSFSGVGVALVGLFYYFIGILTYDGRLEGFFNSPNYLAMYLAPGFIVLCYLLLTTEGKNKIFWLANLIIIGVVLYLTRSYGAWLGISAATLWIFLAGSGENIRYLGSLLFKFYILLFIIFVVFLPFYGGSWVFENNPSFQSRLMIWRTSWEMIKNHPVFGIGPGMFQEYYLKYQLNFKPYLEWAVPHPHNLFLNFWLSGGLVGLFGFVWLLIRFFKKLAADNLSVALSAIIVYIIIHGLFDSTYWKNDLAVIFWVVIGLAAVINKNRISAGKIKNPQTGF